ncbi:MAG: hypothetical protein NZ518_08970, partial [Dehalococcoidia bacterium]|nr:hypothetical protein [Dehalococcoidia bacterium]
MTTSLRLAAAARWRESRLPVAALVVGVAATYALPLPWTLLGAALVVVGAWARIEYGVVAVLLACPFYRPVEANPLPPKAGFGAWEFSLVELLTILVAAAWALRVVAPPHPAARPTAPPVWAWAPPALFVVAALLSTFIAAPAETRGVALRETRTVIVEPVLVGLIALTTLRLPQVRTVLLGLTALGALVGLYSLYHYTVIGVVEATGGVRRVLAVY